MEQKMGLMQEVKYFLNKKLNYFKENKNDFNQNEIIESLKNENSSLKMLMKSYDDRSTGIKDLEEKYRDKQAKYDKELKDLEMNYKEVI